MTAREFKDRLAAGDKLAVVMHALYEVAICDRLKRGNSRLARVPRYIRSKFERDGAHILAALASAGVKK